MSRRTLDLLTPGVQSNAVAVDTKGYNVIEYTSSNVLAARLAKLPTAECTELLEHVYGWDGCVVEICDDGKN